MWAIFSDPIGLFRTRDSTSGGVLAQTSVCPVSNRDSCVAIFEGVHGMLGIRTTDSWRASRPRRASQVKPAERLCGRAGIAACLGAAVAATLLAAAGSTSASADASGTYEPGEPSLSWNRQVHLGFDDSLAAVDDADGVVWSVGRANPANDGNSDAVILRADEDGQILDRLNQGSDQVDAAVGVDAGPWGAVVTGTTSGIFPGGGATSGGGMKGWVQLLNPEGSVVWTTQFGDAHVSETRGVAVLGDQVFVVGTSYPDGQDAELQVWSFSLEAGALVHERHFGTPGDDALGGVVVVGDQVVIGGSVRGDLVAGAGAGEQDAVLLALEPADLSTRWARQFGTAGDDTAIALAERDGIVYWAGALGREDDANYFTPSIGGVGAVRADGTSLWRQRLGASGSIVRSVAATSEGIVLAGGVHPGELGAETPSHGGEDAFLQGRAFTGEVLWTEVYGGPDYDHFMGLSATDDRLLVSGVTYNGMFGRRHGPSSVLARFDVPHLIRPDLAVRSAGGAFVGDNGSALGVRLTVRPGRQLTTTLRLQDDGLLHDRLALRSCSGNKHLRLTVLRDGRDVSPSTRAGIYRTPRLAPGSSQRLQLKIRAGAGARGSYACSLRARSTSDTRKADRIVLRVVVRR
jgi:hypothetical protein